MPPYSSFDLHSHVHPHSSIIHSRPINFYRLAPSQCAHTLRSLPSTLQSICVLSINRIHSSKLQFNLATFYPSSSFTSRSFSPSPLPFQPILIFILASFHPPLCTSVLFIWRLSLAFATLSCFSFFVTTTFSTNFQD